MSTDISVIIPSYNRNDKLYLCLDCLKKQIKAPSFEVIVIDDGSLKEIKYHWHRLKIIRQKNCGPATARNIGIKHSQGKIIVFINDDSIVGEDFVGKHWLFHQQWPDDNMAVLGRFDCYKRIVKTPAMLWLENNSGMHFDFTPVDGIVEWNYLWTCNFSIKKYFLTKNKLLFDRDFPCAAWEDIELAYRCKQKGLKIFYDKSIMAYHNHEFGLDQVLSRFYSHGRGLYHLSLKLPKRYLPPLAKKTNLMLIRIFFSLIFFEKYQTKLIEKQRLKVKLNNMIMHLLIINQKLKGYQYEKSLHC